MLVRLTGNLFLHNLPWSSQKCSRSRPLLRVVAAVAHRHARPTQDQARLHPADLCLSKAGSPRITNSTCRESTGQARVTSPETRRRPKYLRWVRTVNYDDEAGDKDVLVGTTLNVNMIDMFLLSPESNHVCAKK